MCRPRHFLSNWNHYHYDRYRQPKKKGSDCFMRLGSWTYAEILTCLVIFLLCNISLANTSCGRSIIAKKHGIISDGPGVYLRKRSCEWLIKGRQFIYQFRHMISLWLSSSQPSELYFIRHPHHCYLLRHYHFIDQCRLPVISTYCDNHN